MILPMEATIKYEGYVSNGPLVGLMPVVNVLDAWVYELDIYGITCRGASDPEKARMLIPWNRVVSLVWRERE